MATATAAPAADAAARLGRFGSVFDANGLLDRYLVERKEMRELMRDATVAGVDPCFLGEPGVGKTWGIEILCKHGFAEDVRLFTHLLAKDQSADEVLGPRDVQALAESVLKRMVDGFLPTAHYAYLDEWWKGSPTLLNPLLDIMANRVLKVGGHVIKCDQLIAVFLSSNELPEREDLAAMRDRVAITYHVEPVKTPEGRRRVTDIQLNYQANGIDTTGVEPLTLADIQTIRDEARLVEVPEPIREMMMQAQQQWLDKGHPPSQRRIGQMWKVIKARAWAAGRTQVMADDLVVCAHMAWNDPNDADSARDVIAQFAGEFTRKANRMKDTLDPINRETDTLKAMIEAIRSDADHKPVIEKGVEIMGQLKRASAEALNMAQEGEGKGQDVTVLKAMAEEAEQARLWIYEKLSDLEGV